MLVLTRRVKQSIMIGDEIEVSGLAVSGDKVRLGIEAPARVPVYRTEIYLEIQQEAADRRAPGEADREQVQDELRRLGEGREEG